MLIPEQKSHQRYRSVTLGVFLHERSTKGVSRIRILRIRQTKSWISEAIDLLFSFSHYLERRLIFERSELTLRRCFEKLCTVLRALSCLPMRQNGFSHYLTIQGSQRDFSRKYLSSDIYGVWWSIVLATTESQGTPNTRISQCILTPEK